MSANKAATKKGVVFTTHALYSTPGELGKAIREKAKVIFERSGGILTPEALAQELGYKDRRSALKWAQEHDVPAVRSGPRKVGFESEMVARAIVQARGQV